MNIINEGIKHCKRKGFGLPLGLVITAFGLFLVALMFSYVSQFNNIFADYRGSYTEYITASSCVERLKGAIVTANNDTGVTAVLHGTNVKLPYEDNPVVDIEELLISEDKKFEISEEINVNGSRTLVVARAFDAGYGIVQIQPEFFDDDNSVSYEDKNAPNLPPSYFYDSDMRPGFVREDESPSYEEIDMGNVNQTQINDHRRHGAYLIKVWIYNILPNGSRRLVRTTEELFRMFIDI